ncbi:MAG: beta-lactamase family protein [Saprospiraceae bacterium]|nr:beta-lactamase family protein [Saprospiraceae bacterium]
MKTQKTCIYVLLLSFGLWGVSCKSSPSATLEETITIATKPFQAIVDSVYQLNPESVGLMVHIESPRYGLSWSGSSGYSDKENQTKLLPNQPALIASSIKTYIAAAILRLQEMGKLDIEDAIGPYLTTRTANLFQDDGYELNQIKIKHLLSHTSGIADYVTDEYFDFIDKNQTYRWTRDEQLQLAIDVGDPLGQPQSRFSYADVNYLLATEIMEQITQKPFYTSVRELLSYERLGLHGTWFPTLEEHPAHTPELVHQYWNEKAWGSKKLDIVWDSYDHDVSWDLYGGGGIATSMKELAQFSNHLFNGEIIEDEEVLNLLTTDVTTTDGISKTYRLGISDTRIKGLQAYGHGGFWGTIVFYIPKIDVSIAVCVLERNGKMKPTRSLLNALTNELCNQLFSTSAVVTDDYTLYKAKDTEATLVLFPGGGTDAAYTQQEFDIINLAQANHVSVLLMNFNQRIWIDESTTESLAQQLETLSAKHGITTKNTTIGGMSIGGNVALTLSNYLIKNGSEIAPKKVFVVDSPVDLYALYQSALIDVLNPNFDEERLAEPRFIMDYFEAEFTKDSLLSNIQTVSPFTYQQDYTSIPYVQDCALRFYIEPDASWWAENRQTAYENTNAFTIQQVVNSLENKNWERVELIETENKGYRSNGDRHPHSWSIVDMNDLVHWIME